LKALSFGGLNIWPPIMSAPMAGYTDSVFREILREYGCPYCYTEMVSGKGLLLGEENTRELLEHGERDSPLALQLFGEDPDTLALAILKLKRLAFKFEAIDINMGCPARKITSQGAGGALLKDIGRASSIVQACKEVSPVPITAKIRLGWDDPSQCLEISQALASAGLDMITVHGRTVAQGFSGQSDWDWISRVARETSIPVVGNGDIGSPAQALFRLETSGVSGVMIGRGLLGNPFFFREVLEACGRVDIGEAGIKGQGLRGPSPSEKMRVARTHFERAILRYGQKKGLLEMRKHLSFYVRGLRGAPRLRQLINRETSPEKVVELLEHHRWNDTSPVI